MRGRHTEEERRTTERVACKDVRLVYDEAVGFLAGLLYGKHKQRKSKPVPVRNISRDGLCFLSRREFGLGERISVTIQLERHRPTVHAEGEIRWCGRGEGVYTHKVGVGFTDVSGPAWDVLTHLEEVLRKEDKEWTRWRLRSKRRASRPFGEKVDDLLLEAFQ